MCLLYTSFLSQPAPMWTPFFLRLAEKDGEKESSLEHLTNNLNRQYHMSSNHLLAMRRVELPDPQFETEGGKCAPYGLNCISIPTD